MVYGISLYDIVVSRNSISYAMLQETLQESLFGYADSVNFDAIHAMSEEFLENRKLPPHCAPKG